MFRLSRACVNYLLLERKWLRAGRPDELYDRLDDTWYEMVEGPNAFEDEKFLNGRGGLIHDNEENPSQVDHDATKGNGYCFKWLDDYEMQIMRRYQNG